MSELQQLISDLTSDEIQRRRDAATVMMSSNGVESAAVELVEAVGSNDAELVEAANGALEGIESVTSDQAAKLVEMLPRENSQPVPSASVYWAATLLGRMESAAAPLVDRMIESLPWCQDLSALQRIVWAIGKVGSPASHAVSALQPLTASEDPRLARLATQAIENVSV